MTRRAFISLLGGAATCPCAVRAQQGVPVIGFLGPGSAAGQGALVIGLRRRLGETGFVDGQNVSVEFRWADNQVDRLPALAAELVHRQASVIVTAGVRRRRLRPRPRPRLFPLCLRSAPIP